MKKYRFPEVNLEAKFKEFKKKASTGEDSTDDEEILEKAHGLFKDKKKKIMERNQRLAKKKEMRTNKLLEATMDYIHDNDIEGNVEDEDDDRAEFADARIEEVEDKLIRMSKKKNRKLNKRDIRRICKHNGVEYEAISLDVLNKVMVQDDFQRILTESVMK